MQQANPPGAGLSWLMLTSPTRAWHLLSTGQCALPAWAPSLIAQWLMLGAAQVISLQAVFELASHAGLTNAQLPPGALAVAWQLILFALGIVLGNACAGLLIWGLSRLTSITATYQQSFILASYALLPAVLGHALGMVILAIAQPLSRQPAHAVALLIRPFSCGLASFAPFSGQPLSLGWVFASYFDIPGLWSLALAIGGAVLYLRAPFRKAAWLGLGLVLSLAAVLTGWWQLLQMLAIR